VLLNIKEWQKIGWRHNVWELVRYYHSIRSKPDDWLKNLSSSGSELAKLLQISKDDLEILNSYIQYRKKSLKEGLDLLRTEEEAIAFCKSEGFKWGITKTKSKDHHQATKTLIATVAGVAQPICDEYGVSLNPNPSARCIWRVGNLLHVCARNLDGAIPDLADPFVVWEIKEYWGKTGGGSKMSDAVYECQLVGREIREFEAKAKIKINHFAFVDGKEQWGSRKSDLLRLIDLTSQGLLDDIFIGADVEKRFGKVLTETLNKRRSI